MSGFDPYGFGQVAGTARDFAFPTGIKMSDLISMTQSRDPIAIMNQLFGPGKKGGATTPSSYDPSDQGQVPVAPAFGSTSPMGADARSALLSAMASRGRGGGVSTSAAGPGGDPMTGAQPLPGGMGAMPSGGGSTVPGVSGGAGGVAGGSSGGSVGGAGGGMGGDPLGNMGAMPGGGAGVLPGGMGALAGGGGQPLPGGMGALGGANPNVLNRLRAIFAGA